MDLKFNPQDLTIGELVDLEELAGRESVSEIIFAFQNAVYSGRDVLALAATFIRQTAPDTTWADCQVQAKAIRLRDINVTIDLGTEDEA